MKTVILRGPTLTQSGYGVHARQIAKWLLSRKDLDVKFHLLPWGDTPWILNHDAYDGMAGEIIKRSCNDKARADVSLQLQLPNEWNTSIAKFNVGMTAGVETDRCNPSWVNACNNMSRIIVPSNHVASCLTNSGTVTTPINVVPESYIDAIKNDNIEQKVDFSTSFNFLVFGQLTGNNQYNDRKNTYFTLKWLCETFKNNKDIGIVIKTNAGRNSKIDRNIVFSTISKIISEVRKDSQYPKIHILHGDMNDDEVASLYRHPKIKALVSLTHGEGFGLPILEAAASGLPVIVTDWSAHLDFLKLGKYISIFYQLAQIHPSRIDGNIFVKDAKWAMPLEDDFKSRVEKFYKNPHIPKQWALELSQKIQENYSHSNIVSMYENILKDVL